LIANIQLLFIIGIKMKTMNIIILLTGVLVSYFVFGNNTQGVDADLVIKNGSIYTVNPSQPMAQAVAIKDGEFIFVGTDANVTAFEGTNTEIINLQGKMLMPGIHDVHTHPLEAGSTAITCILDLNQSVSNWVSTANNCNQQSPGTDWLLGWGHSLEPLVESVNSPVSLLDGVSQTRPIAFMEFTSHSFWVNSKAMELLGIDENTIIPPVLPNQDLVFKSDYEINWNDKGGAILKDVNGFPNGILLDAAGEMVLDFYYQPTPQAINDHYNSLLYGLEQLAQNGITSVVDSRVYWKRGYVEAWKRAEQLGTLTARSALSLWAYPWDDDTQQIATLASMYESDQNKLLKINQIKMYSDGILHNSTAALNEPYLQFFDEVGEYGQNYFHKDRIARYTKELSAIGFDMQIHAIGDRGVSESLDAIELAQNTGPIVNGRHRITHVEMVREIDKPRFAQLNVIADFQLAGDFTDPSNFSDFEYLIGDRAQDLLPVRDVLDSGATVTLSSDWDVSSLSPFVGMQNALTRSSQKFPNLASVIESYTINGAYVMRQENITGSIEVGKLADFIVLDQNIFNIPQNQIGQTQVLNTYLEGEQVFPSN
jgi:predicted amidohydrolase YtcJ